MEPTSTAPRKGKTGSLENPEVLENVPGHIIPILEREFDDFDNEAEKFLDGQTPEEAAAVMAAVEQFLRDTTPPPAPEAPRESPWVRAARLEAVDREPFT